MEGLLNVFHTCFVFGRRVRRLAELLREMIPSGARVLDVGCGDGQVSAQIWRSRPDISVVGIDVLLRPQPHIAVEQFDGTTIPFGEASFDVVMFVDVLHHTTTPEVLLAEAARVTKRYVLLKDHFRTGFFARATLRFMDWFGNIHHGVALPYNYFSEPEWNQTYHRVGLNTVRLTRQLKLYPNPANLVFGRELHFLALLEKNNRPETASSTSPGRQKSN